MSSKSSPASSFGPECGSSLNSHSDNDQIMEDYRVALSHKLIDMVGEISAIPEYRSSVKKQYMNLARRLKLLMPMFEEIRDSKDPLPEDTIRALSSLLSSLVLAKELLRFGSEGSKIYLVLERDQVMARFQEVTSELEKALGNISFEKLDISDEVKEQAELVLAQFRRAKGRVDAPDVELYEDLLCLYNNTYDPDEEFDLLIKCVDKLQLCNVSDLTQESLALHEMVASTDGDPEARLEKMSMLLKKIKDFVLTMNPNIDLIEEEKSDPSNACRKILKNQKSLLVPDDFRCPISLELMRDPVIISTGQTYERTSIEKWLEAGHSTCPKTQQALTSSALTPNYVLRSLIAHWCETMGIEPPTRPRSAPTQADLEIQSLLQKLTSDNPDDQRSAAGEIRLLAKRNTDNRLAIAEAGAIPLLVHLLSTPDSRIQEHAVTALLNLSICEDNKGAIISSGAVPGIVEVLKKGSMEARENAAATLFSLSVVDENKITIGSSGAIPPLVTLLEEGSQRGKKDAATALFNLCIYQGNKGKAVRAGVISTLMKLVTEPQGTMVDEALAILAILVGHPEAKAAIGAAEAVPILVNVISNGSSRNKENAAAVLLHLCSGAQQHLIEAQELGIMSPLLDLSQNGTERGRRKAAQLLERMNRIAETTDATPGSSRHKSIPEPSVP